MSNSSQAILAVIDPTVEKQPALEQAVVLAQKLNKPLELFICTHGESIMNYHHILGDEAITSLKEKSLEYCTKQLEVLSAPIREKGISVSIDVFWDRPLDEGIVRKALRSNPFMIVKDTHYHRKVMRSLLRNTDWGLIRTCPVPILFVKQHVPWHSPDIVTAVNPINDEEIELDLDLVKMGEVFVKSMNATHKMYHSYEPLTFSYAGIAGVAYVESLDKENEKIAQLHQNRLQDLASKTDVASENIVYEEGWIKTKLLDFVHNQNIDLVIMGSVSKSRMEQAFIGGVTEAVIDEIECDVLTMKPSSFVTPVNPEPPEDYPYIVSAI